MRPIYEEKAKDP